jgi:Domain of Unknown Function with PDB structure (DUF3857)/Transglutaminase-like superfamily
MSKRSKYIILFFLSFFVTSIQAQDLLDYSAQSIPKILLNNAHTIIRKSDKEFIVIDKGNAIEKEHVIMTLMNAAALSNTKKYFDHNKFNEIKDLEAFIYDSQGKLIRKLKNNEFSDEKIYEEYVDDYKYKVINFPISSYPFTIEYKITKKIIGLLHYPVWTPQEGFNTAIQKASFKVVLPESMKPLRYKLLNGLEEPNLEYANKNRQYIWELNKLDAIKEEAYTPNNNKTFKQVFIAPNDFKIEGYEGDLSSWKSLGSFLYLLGSKKNELPETTKTLLKNLVKDCKNDIEKIEKVYNYLQNTTRYFSIQLGIGGWQPIAASDVDKRKYGDCKALSNYMISMLNAIGIEGKYAIIRAGNDAAPQFDDFPNAYFNHAVACVPMEKDTIWLECTSQNESCGFMSDFTSDRSALIVDKEGGTFVKTKVYDEKVNFTNKNVEIQIDQNGNAAIDLHIEYSGVNQSNIAQIAERSISNQKKYISETFKVNIDAIEENTFQKEKGRIPIVKQFMKLKNVSFGSKTEKRQFIPVNLFLFKKLRADFDSVRIHEIQLSNMSEKYVDSSIFHLPPGFSLESKPTNNVYNSIFGSFELTINILNLNTIQCIRKLIINNKIFPKEKYPELIEFLKNVNNSDKTQLVIFKSSN